MKTVATTVSAPQPAASHVGPATLLRRCFRITGLRSRLLLLYPAGLLTVLGVMLAGDHAGIPFSVFTQDPLAVAKGRPYFGLLSNLGVLLWGASAVLCLFAGSVASEILSRRKCRFLLASGWLTLVLVIDDLFMLHEDVFPVAIGIRQRYVLLTYFLATAIYLYVFYEEIIEKHALLLVVSLGFFSLSMTEDLAALTAPPWHYLLEDGSKLFGIIGWFIYFAAVVRDEVRGCIGNKST